MPARIIIPTGTRFGKLTVLKFAGTTRQGKCYLTLWRCICDCGKETIVRTSYLKSGHTRSCGCLAGQQHKMTGTPEHKIWLAMRARVKNLDDPLYGGRGIVIDPAWESFTQFFIDMGPRPSLYHSIERKNNNGNYSPDNCKWATAKEQALNRRSNRLITFRGKTQHLSKWAEETGIPDGRIRKRLNRGWPVKKALTQKRMKSKYSFY